MGWGWGQSGLTDRACLLQVKRRGLKPKNGRATLFRLSLNLGGWHTVPMCPCSPLSPQMSSLTVSPESKMSRAIDFVKREVSKPRKSLHTRPGCPNTFWTGHILARYLKDGFSSLEEFLFFREVGMSYCQITHGILAASSTPSMPESTGGLVRGGWGSPSGSSFLLSSCQ